MDERKRFFRVRPANARFGYGVATLSAFRRGLLAFAAVAWAVAANAPCLANPTGGVTAGGEATISESRGVVTIDQKSDRAVINWQGFSVGGGELARFRQPGQDAITLNRVVGEDPSRIDGSIQANGQVWLVNPNGVLFGPTATVDVHGLVATTADIADGDFLGGRYIFSTPSSNAGASVINKGTISIGECGLGALVAPHVKNDGIINGRLGQVVIGGAPTFTLDFYGDGLVKFAAGSEVVEALDASAPLASNNGRISMDGGSVLITARAAAGVVDEAINMGGVVEAKSFREHNGTIILDGGDNGAVRVSGSLDASGREAGQAGGVVKVLGEKVGLYSGAQLDASGDAGGGQVLVGGAFRGEGPEVNAKRTYVSSGAEIHADAQTSGNGGQVVVWGDEIARFFGTATARGGAGSGDGGQVEISSAGFLDFRGAVDASSTAGATGVLLLDPANIWVIDDVEAGSDLGDVDDFSDPDSIVRGTDYLTGAAIDAYLISSAKANVVLQATENIFFEASVDIETPGVGLTAEAKNNVTVAPDANITTNGGDVTLHADYDNDGSGSLIIGGEENDGGEVALAGAASTSKPGYNLWANEITTNGGDFTGIGGKDSQGASGVQILNAYIDAGADDSDGGDIFIQSGGDIYMNGGALGSWSSAGTAGNVTLSAVKDIYTSYVYSYSETGSGGAVTLTSGGSIYAGPVFLGGYSTMNQGALRVDAPGVVDLSLGLIPVGADVLIGETTRPSDVVLPESLYTYGGSVTLHLSGDYVYNCYLVTDGGDVEVDSLGALTIASYITTGQYYYETSSTRASDPSDSGGDATFHSIGNLTFLAPVSTHGGVIVAATESHFLNGWGPSVFDAADGRYLVYSSSPTGDESGLESGSYGKLYDFPYNASDPEGAAAGLPMEGNYFLYSMAPTLTITASNSSRPFGTENPQFTYTVSGLIEGDSLDDALSLLPVLSTTATLYSPGGIYAILVGPEGLSSPLRYRLNLVNGELTVSAASSPQGGGAPQTRPSYAGIVEESNLIKPEIDLEQKFGPSLPISLTETPGAVFKTQGMPKLPFQEDLLFSNDGNQELWGPASGD